MSSYVIGFPKDIVISKLGEIKNIFEDEDCTVEFVVNKALVKIDDLRSLLQTNNINELNTNLSCDINDRSCCPKCENIVNWKLKDQYEKFKKDNDELQAKIHMIENDLSVTVKKLTLEKEEYKLRVEALSDDLEQQIEECIELNNKLIKFNDIEEVLQNKSVNDCTKDSRKVNDKNENNYANNSDINMSIIDIDAMHIDSICWPEDQTTFFTHVEPSKERIKNFRIADSSCFNLDNLNSELLIDDSTNMFEELQQFVCEDSGKIDTFIEKSISIFMKTVLKKLDCRKNSTIEYQLKKAFLDYRDLLLNKLKSIKHSYEDLNSTCIFEKLERELQADDEISETKNKIATLTSELHSTIENMKNVQRRLEEVEGVNRELDLSLRVSKDEIERLIKYKEELSFCKENNDSRVVSLSNKISELTSALQSASDNITNSQLKLEEMEGVNYNLESLTKDLEKKIEILQTEKENIAICNENDRSIVHLLTNKISALTSELESAFKNGQVQLESSSKDLQGKIEKLETKNEELVLSNLNNISLIDSLNNKISDLTLAIENSLLRLEEMKEVNQELESSSKDIQTEMSRLQTENEEFKLCHKNDHFLSDSLNNKILTLTSELESAFENMKILRLKLEDEKGVIHELESSSKRLQNEIERLQTEKEELALSKDNNSTLVDSLNHKISYLTSELILSNDNLHNVCHRLEEIEGINNELESLSKSLQNEIERLRSENEELALCKEKDRSLVDSLTNNVSILTSDLQSAFENGELRLEKMEVVNCELLSSSKRLQGELERLQKEREELSLFKENNRSLIDSLTNKISLLTSELESAFDNMKNVQLSIEDEKRLRGILESSLKELQDENRRLRTENEEFGSYKDNKDSYVDLLTDKILDLTSELELSHDNIKNARQSLEQLEVVNRELESLSKGLHCEIERLQIEEEKLALCKENDHSLADSLNNKISTLTFELESALKNLNNAQLKLEEEKVVSHKLQSSSIYFQKEIERLITEIEELEFGKKNNILIIDSLNNKILAMTSELDLAFDKIKKLQLRLVDEEQLKSSSIYFQNEIERLSSEKKEFILCNNNKDSYIESLTNKISELTHGLQSAFENMTNIQMRLEEEETVNREQESLSKYFQNEIDRVTVENAGLVLSIETKDSIIDSLTNNISDLTSELQLSNDNIMKVRQRLKELEGVTEELESLSKCRQDEIEGLRIEIEGFKLEIEELALNKENNISLVDSLNNKISALTSVFEKAQIRLEEVEGVNEELESSLKGRQNEIEKLRTENEQLALCNENDRSLIDSLTNKISTLTSELESAFENIKNLQFRLEEKEVVSRELQSLSNGLNNEIERLRMEIEELRLSKENNSSLVDSLNNKISNMTSDFEKAQIQFEEMERVNCDLESSSKRFQDELERLETENDELVLAKENDRSLIDSFTTKMSALTSELDSALENIKNIQLRLEEEEAVNLKQELSLKSFENKIEIITAENLDLTLCNKSKSALIDSLSNKISELELSYDNMLNIRQRIEEIEGVNRELELSSKCLQIEIERLRTENDQLALYNGNDRSLVDSLTSKVSDLTFELELSNEDMKNAKQRVEEMESLSKNLQNEIDKLRTENEELIQAVKSETNAKDNDEWIEIARLQSELDQAESVISEMINNLSDRDKDIRELSDERVELLRKNEVADTLVKDLSVEMDLQTSMVFQISQKLKQTKEELISVRSELSISRQKSLSMQGNLVEINRELESLKNADSHSMEIYDANLCKKNAELQSKVEELKWKNLTIKELEEKLNESLLVQERERKRLCDLMYQFDRYKRDQEKSDENKENVCDLEKELTTLRSELETKNTMLKNHDTIVTDYDLLIGTYNELKGRYREKRRRTDELTAKYERLMSLCRERGILTEFKK